MPSGPTAHVCEPVSDTRGGVTRPDSGPTAEPPVSALLRISRPMVILKFSRSKWQQALRQAAN